MVPTSFSRILSIFLLSPSSSATQNRSITILCIIIFVSVIVIKNSDLMSMIKSIWKNTWVILKYATTHNHPQPPTTIHNHPQPPTTIHNHPQTPTPNPKLPTTIHNHPQPPIAIQNSPEITQESQNLSQKIMLLQLRYEY